MKIRFNGKLATIICIAGVMGWIIGMCIEQFYYEFNITVLRTFIYFDTVLLVSIISGLISRER